MDTHPREQRTDIGGAGGWAASNDGPGSTEHHTHRLPRVCRASTLRGSETKDTLQENTQLALNPVSLGSCRPGRQT